MEKKFEIYDLENSDKEITIFGPNDLRILIDYDDVDHTKVLKNIKKMIKILNDNWDK